MTSLKDLSTSQLLHIAQEDVNFRVMIAESLGRLEKGQEGLEASAKNAVTRDECKARHGNGGGFKLTKRQMATAAGILGLAFTNVLQFYGCSPKQEAHHVAVTQTH